jgi:hypothetical protein
MCALKADVVGLEIVVFGGVNLGDNGLGFA